MAIESSGLKHFAPRGFAMRLSTALGILLVVIACAGAAKLLQDLSRYKGADFNQFFYQDLGRLKAGQNDDLTLYCTQDTDSLLSQLRGMPEVTRLKLELTDATDAGMRNVATLPELRELVLYGGRPRVGNRGLTYLRACVNLESLSLINTDVTDNGLVALKGLRGLTSLTLFWDARGEPTIRDAGLVHLTSLRNLESLALTGRWVGDAGLPHLRGMRLLRSLRLEGENVTDSSIPNLKELSLLEKLDVRGTRITDAGIAELKKALPELAIEE